MLTFTTKKKKILTFPVPAKIMSFNKNVITPWKEKLNLTCLNVGIPNPNLIWKFKSTQIKNTNSRIQV